MIGGDLDCREPAVGPKPCPQTAAHLAPGTSYAAVRRAYISAKAVGSFIPALTAPAFRKFGFSAATLITDWPAIAGRELASHVRRRSA